MYDRVLVPLDGSATAEQVLPFVRMIPSRSLRLLRVIRPRSPAASRRQAQEALEAVAANLATEGRTVDVAVVPGEPADQIVAAAAGVDLTVMTTCGEGAGGQLIFGSVADRVARHAPVPTLLVRAGDDPVAASSMRRIVVPLDGSAVAARAVAVAAKLREALGCRILLVSIAESPAADPAPVLGASLSTTSDAGNQGERQRRDAYLREIAPTAGQPDDVATVVGVGDPSTELLAAIAPDDLVVMTTHGGGGAQRWRIGSVAAHLLRHAPAPVLLVRGDRHDTGA